jgi:hypothetical protein
VISDQDITLEFPLCNAFPGGRRPVQPDISAPRIGPGTSPHEPSPHEPIRMNPVRMNPVRMNPVRINPVRINPVRDTVRKLIYIE